MKLEEIQEMQPRERADWLRQTASIQLESPQSDTGYPIDILRNSDRIGKIVRSRNRIVIELEGIGEFDKEKAFNTDALEICEIEWLPNVDISDDDAERINQRIYYFLGEWAQQNPPKN